MDNLIQYLVLIVAAIFGASFLKQFSVKQALDSLDKKTEVLKTEEQVFQKKIDTEEARLKVIEAEEAAKSKDQIIDFWDKQGATDEDDVK